MTDQDPTAPRAASSGGTASGLPLSVLVCAECGKKNKIRPSERGTPHCGSCSQPLAWVVDATDATFPYEARASVAVLVDLWAPWCGPCRVVGPMLEMLAREYAGRIKVVKVNVDEEQELAVRYQIQSIPTLVVFHKGQPVNKAIGAVPQRAIEQLIKDYV